MVDIELTGIRTRDPEHRPFDTSQVGLLSSDSHDGVANGNGHLHPENEAFLRTALEKPPSVSVLRKPRRKWWILALILVLVLVVIAICLGLLFLGVSDNGAAVHAAVVLNTTVNTSLVSSPQPPQQTQRPVPELHIQSFQAFPEYSDSKLLEASFSNGATVRTFGHKGTDGSFHSLYSISVGGDAKGSDLTHIYFRGQSNFASVMLPQGTIVSYDWTSGFKSLECKIFSVPKTPGADVNTPLSHVVTLPLGEHADIFVRITKGLIKPHVQFRTNVTREECNSRLPLRVTKCGQQYTYPGAFIQGILTPEAGPSVSMDALPWPTTQDNCYDGEKEMPNYFLPLPLQTNVSIQERKRRFSSTGTSVFMNLCLSIEGSESSLDSDICKEIASGLTEDQEVLYDHIYGSCFKIFHSIRLICISLKVSSSRDVSAEQFQLSKAEIYQSLYQNSVSVESILGPRLYVTVTAYCPSVHPVSSYRQLINQSKPITLKDMIHINCPNSPEVTRFVIGHKFIGPSTSSSQLDRIDHLLAICASCASGTVMHVQVSRDETCCSNTCSGSNVCEIGPHFAFSENTKFDEQKDVYCYQFLKDYKNNMPVVNRTCVQGCEMRFSVEFKLYRSDPDDQQTFYSQRLSCDKEDAFSCKKTFGR